LESEAGIEFHVHTGGPGNPNPTSVLLVVLNEHEAGKSPDWLNEVEASGMNIALCEPRGIGETRWTRKNGPNYVERSHALLGRTVDAGRVWDVVAAAKYLAGPDSPVSPDDPKRLTVHVAGKGPAGLIAAYAAALDDSIAGVTIIAPPKTHMDPAAPQLLNVLRVCDVPDSLGLIAPRPLTLVGADAADFKRTAAAYAAAEAGNHLTIKP
jgi:hypothetical protein